MNCFRIRQLTADDYPAVDGLMQQLHRLHVDGRPDLYLPVKHPYTQSEYEKMLDLPQFITLCAEIDNRVVAMATATLRPKSGMVDFPTAYLNELVVADDFQHRGIAKALYSAICKEAKEHGAHRLDLMVWDFNERAKAFYEGLGMTAQRHIYEKEL